MTDDKWNNSFLDWFSDLQNLPFFRLTLILLWHFWLIFYSRFYYIIIVFTWKVLKYGIILRILRSSLISGIYDSGFLDVSRSTSGSHMTEKLLISINKWLWVSEYPFCVLKMSGCTMTSKVGLMVIGLIFWVSWLYFNKMLRPLIYHV